MTRIFFALGAFLAFLAVAAGAFGAHALEARLAPDRLDTFQLAARYQMYHALALLAVAWAGTRWPGPATAWAGWLFVAGIVVFSGSLYALALGAPRWFGAITPIGGLSFMAGWLLLAWAALREGRSALVLGLAFALGACAGGGEGGEGGDALEDEEAEATAGLPGAKAGGRVVFTCDDGFKFAARFREDGVGLVLPFGNEDLPATDAEGRYGDAQRFLRVWGDLQARYEAPDGGRRRCTGVAAADPREESRLLGYDYRAVGQEPGWVLEIDEDRWIRYSGDYGATTVVTPVSPPVDSAAGTVLHSRTDAHELRVYIAPGPCEDAMSGEAYADHVEVTVDGVELKGCGEELGGSVLPSGPLAPRP